jgi:hypothetical protein
VEARVAGLQRCLHLCLIMRFVDFLRFLRLFWLWCVLYKTFDR